MEVCTGYLKGTLQSVFPCRQLTTYSMYSIENGGSPKGYRVLCRNPEGKTPGTRKGRKQSMFADLSSRGLQFHTSFPPWMEFVCIPHVFCFPGCYQFTFLSSARRKAWPIPPSCHQTRVIASLSVVYSAQENRIWSNQPCVSSKGLHVYKHSTGLRRNRGPWTCLGMLGMLHKQNIYNYVHEPWSCYTAVYWFIQS